MTRPKALERFKNDLDRYNFCLHQIAEESNIQLSPNIVRQHGYYAPLHVEGFYVLDGEQSYNQDPQRFHAFDDYSNDALLRQSERLRDDLRILKDTYRQRQIWVNEFRRVWECNKYSVPEFAVYFGLSHAVIAMPLELFLKYKIRLSKSYSLTQRLDLLGQERNYKVLAKYGYHNFDLANFDNHICYIKYRLEHYREQHCEEYGLHEFDISRQTVSADNNWSFTVVEHPLS